MKTTATRLTATALTLSALLPAAALAGGATSHPQLGGAPQMRLVDDRHATLRFASDRLPRTASGRLDARITYANGSRVSNLSANGRHGGDVVYTARVTSPRRLHAGQKLTVTFRLGDSAPVKRIVTVHARRGR